jgi:hypothetical protein
MRMCPGPEAATVQTPADSTAEGWRSCRDGTLRPRIRPVEQLGEVGASMAPVERHRGLLVAALEGKQAALDLGGVTEVVG